MATLPSSASPSASSNLLVAAAPTATATEAVSNPVVQLFATGSDNFAVSNFVGDISMETSSIVGLQPNISNPNAANFSDARRVREGPVVPVLANLDSPPRDGFAENDGRPIINFQQIFQSIENWGEEEQPPPLYSEDTPIRPNNAPAMQNVGILPQNATEDIDWDAWANSTAQHVENIRGKLENLQQQIGQRLFVIEGRENLFPQLAKRVMEAENLVLQEKQRVDQLLQAVNSLQETQKIAVDALKSNTSETLKALQTDQQKISEVLQRLSNLETRPTSIVIQTPSDGPISAQIVEEINKNLQDMQIGVHGWQTKMEKAMEEKHQAFCEQFAVWRNEILQNQQNLGAQVANLRSEMGDHLRALEALRKSDLVQLQQGVGQAVSMVMAKIPRDPMHVLQDSQGPLAAQQLSKETYFACTSHLGQNQQDVQASHFYMPQGPKEKEGQTYVSEIPSGSKSHQGQKSYVPAPVVAPLSRPLPKIDRSKRSVGRTFFSAGLGGHPPESAVFGAGEVRAVSTAPVGMVDTGSISVIPQQILSLVLGKGPGPFSGQRGDWPEWKRKFLRFLEEIQQVMPTISDRQLFSVARQFLDPGSNSILEATLISNQNLEFSAFWARLEIEMGSDDPEELRVKWYTLKPRHQGTLRLADWRIFMGEFLRLKTLIDGNEEEAKAILMRALPIEFRKKILQEEDKKTQDRLALTGVGMLNNNEIVELILSETGINPHIVSRRGDKVIISLPGISAKEKVFQMLDRENLVGGGMISVKQESTALLSTEIDALMRRWLTVDDRARLRDGASSSSQSSPSPNQKWQREVKATPEDAAIQEIKVTKTTQTIFFGGAQGGDRKFSHPHVQG